MAAARGPPSFTGGNQRLWALPFALGLLWYTREYVVIHRRGNRGTERMRENPVKQLLKAGRPAIGTWLTLGDPLATETLAHLGFDWLNVDMEHGSIDVRETRGLFQVINTTDVVPTARVPWNDHVWIKRVLDAGAYGVVVPMVRSREEAERAVAACRYPPAGHTQHWQRPQSLRLPRHPRRLSRACQRPVARYHSDRARGRHPAAR